MLAKFIVLFSLTIFANTKVYIYEKFEQPFSERWQYSEDKSVSHGVFESISNEFCETGDRAIKAVNDSSFYHASAKLNGVLDTRKNELYLHYVTMFTQEIDCGGAYIKLFSDLDQKTLTGDSPYLVMVGPDVCGHDKRMAHLIISHLGKNFLLKDQVDYEVDKYPHLISLHLSENKFSFKVDGVVKREGSYKENFEYLLPEYIDDPTDHKPEEWVDEETIDDPEDVRPEDWDDRKEIPDPDATKPDNWDDSTDVEWEPNLIKNPAYKGEWSPKQISNPKFKGHWKPRQIPNPEYKDDNDFARFEVKHIGFDLWTVKSGTVFDEIFLTDSADESNEHSSKVLTMIKEQTDKMKAKEKEKVDEKPADKEGSEQESDSSDTLPESDEEPKTVHEDL